MRRMTLALMAGLFLLSACALDEEEEVRAMVSPWVQLGDTYFFESSSTCTAAVFHTASPRISSLVSKARSVSTGMKMLSEGKPVSFDVGGKTPNMLTEEIMSRDLPQGISVLNSGLAGANCMSELVKSIYYQAIMNPQSRLIFVPDGDAMIVVDRQAGALIYVRGNG
ncbi:hypothetical protein PXK00_02405 [Phaeobacter sp. QD34_3]|uniref:hypothetical protein n=1 Tax=unclassified Phaeobacter TaxID=2621772 RepID=UPI00237F2039|nr:MULTISPECIES: hypothetical protein [unclassified Phaeobacter]MDE4131945.1 hypothetical protein [Phaeobacter sp. QD34_3]MDE4135583.1 hypothetical protein [Phaeobacter sp. QD34_24]MDE4173572.1 hypothetical protein [Phaeobacter sp. PT47_59]